MSGRFEQDQRIFDRIEYRLRDYPPIISDYYRVMKSQGKTAKTIEAYIGYVWAFIDHYDYSMDDEFYKKVKTSQIMEYLDYRKTRIVNGRRVKTSSALATNIYRGLYGLFQYCEEEGLIDRSPVRESLCPKQHPEKNTTYLTQEEVNGIYRNIEAHSSDKFKNRNLLLFTIGVTTGLRVSAILNIDISDIDFKKQNVKVVEKGEHYRTILLGGATMQLLNRWLVDRQKIVHKTNTSDALFINQFQRRMCERDVNSILHTYSAGVTDKNVTPHVMRHTCATLLYAETGDIYLVSKQLGHASVTTSQRYAAIFDERQQKATNILNGFIPSVN